VPSKSSSVSGTVYLDAVAPPIVALLLLCRRPTCKGMGSVFDLVQLCFKGILG